MYTVFLCHFSLHEIVVVYAVVSDVNTALSILSIAYCGTVLMPLRVLIRLSSRFGDIVSYI